MNILKYNNNIILLNNSAVQSPGCSFVVVTTNKKFATLTCGNQSYTLTGDELSHAFEVNAGTYTCTATLGTSTNSDTVTVTTNDVYNVGLSLSRLPLDYIEIEYLQDSGKQYINTRFKPNNNTSVKTKALITTNEGFVFGSRTSASANDRYTFVAAANISQYRSDFYNNSVAFATITGQTDPFVVDKNKNVCTLTLNDSSVYTVTNTDGSFTSSYDMFMFACNTGGSYDTGTTGTRATRIYYLEIYDNGTLVHNFIPARQISTSTLGMYDIVSNVFFTNDGTDYFIAGPDVN